MSLFELTLGIDSEDTGYETIVTAGMLHGMTQAEIEDEVPEDRAVQRARRIPFAAGSNLFNGHDDPARISLATVFEPEILLLDEGIGAGDARFTDRASARLKELAKKSAILVLASHTDDLIRSICNKAALMNSGRLVKIGPVDEILSEYHTEKARSELQATAG